MQEAVAYTCQDNLPYYYDPGELPDRLYARWRSAMLRRDAAQVGLIQIRCPNLVRVLKGFQPKQVDLDQPESLDARPRVSRHPLAPETVWPAACFRNPPSAILSFVFVRPGRREALRIARHQGIMPRDEVPD